MAIVLPEGRVCLVDIALGDHLADAMADRPRHTVTSGVDLGAVVGS
jgi:hypothetical protein